MPDTFTHIALPFVFSRFLRFLFILPVFLFGTVFPDYIREFIALILPVSLYGSIYVFNSLFGAFFSSIFISTLFSPTLRSKVFLSFFGGQIVHFIFDLCQSYLCGGSLYLFFPYWYTFEIGFISETNWLYLFLFSASVFCGYVLWIVIKKNRQRISE